MNTNRLFSYSEIPMINKSLSWKAKGTNVVVVRVEGVTKLLGCSPVYFKTVLSAIDGKRTVEEVITVLSDEYSKDGILTSLNVLWGQGIITGTGCEEKNEKGMRGWIAVAGDGALAEALCRELARDVGISGYKILDQPCRVAANGSELKSAIREQLDDRCVFIIACPARANYEMLLAMNDLALETDIPVVFCYYNGVKINLGPIVIPWKTPCLGCLLESEYSLLGKNRDITLELGDILPLVDAWPLVDGLYDVGTLDWVSRYAASDVIEFLRSSRVPRLAKKQLTVPLRVGDDHDDKPFEPLSTCCSCSGMNRRGPVPLTDAKPGRTADIMVADKEAVYCSGGLRSVARDEARNFIQEVMERIDHTIKIERVTTTPLDRFLFKFTAEIIGRYNPGFPFLMPPLGVSRGKGLTEDQAYLSAAFELFERLSAFYHGDVEIVRASYKEAQSFAIDVNSFIGEVCYDQVLDHFSEDMQIDWVWGHSLIHDRPVLVPASMVFLSGKFLGHFFEPTSGGLASGVVLEDAILQGLLEVIEHDAWMIWQANAVTTPEIKLESIERNELRQTISTIQENGFKLILRDCTTDFTIPVIKAWLVKEKSYDHYAYFGWGASLNPDIALERALTEANQSIMPKKVSICSPSEAPNAWSLVTSVRSLYGLYSLNQSEIIPRGTSKAYSEIKDISTGSVSGDIRKLVSQVQKTLPDVDVVIVNLTKPEFGVPVVRALIGGGVQRFGRPIMSACRRLFELPVKMGYREKVAEYNQLYLGQFPS